MTQPIFDQKQGGFRVFIGNLGSRTNISELQHECERYGPLVDCWVARNPPGFAFILYKYGEDANSAVRNMDGRLICGQRVRVEHAKARSLNPRNAPKYGGSRSGDNDDYRRRPRHRSRSRSSNRERSKKKSSRHRDSSRDSSRESTPRRKRRSHSTSSDDSSSNRDKKRHRTRSKSSTDKKSSNRSSPSSSNHSKDDSDDKNQSENSNNESSAQN